ncbi:MAG: thioredoxin domain-containing protein [bacterium]
MTQSDKNKLADATSPYLLEHADNPVNWHQWGDEALTKAREEDKPIFLSIGYSACHWCHVMKRESFQDPETAELMNRWFVNIKVDREERPDLDEIYMQAVQAMAGRGGWPMSVWLTPDLKPFYGGTYFPAEPKQGMPDFRSVLKQVHETYEEKPDEIEKSASKLMGRLKDMETIGGGTDVPEETLLDQGYQQLSNRFDSSFGGFGEAPKFPRVMDLQLLLRLGGEERFSQAYSMVQSSLDAMMQGGIYDQVGGGFSRYSTDRQWLVPHFEKMLYDNAQLLEVYSEGYRLFDEEEYRRIAEQTYDYMIRDLGHDDGAFYSSQDAESEGEEGKYYVWDYEEFHEVLDEESDLLEDFWGVTPDGNFEGSNILNRTVSKEDFAEQNGMDLEEFDEILETAKRKLLDVREERIKPHLDDKVLTNWNGLALAGCARAGFIFDNGDMVDRAASGINFIKDVMMQDGILYHTHREDKTHTPGFLDDYAFTIKALLELFQATGDPDWLEDAQSLYDQAVGRFWDEEKGGFFYASADHDYLLVRSKNPQDKAEPSGNSEMVLNSLKLADLTGKTSYSDRAGETLAVFESQMRQSPNGLTRMLCGLHDYYSPSVETVVIGDRQQREELLEPLRETFLPGSVLYQADPSQVSEGDSVLLEGRLDSGEPTAYVCKDRTCQEPAHTAEEVTERLEAL